ncbi:MAG: hypothetical protein COV31_01885 [Candidatus Yanofskybacteria bacterium CG10_big_fil_rev_8_21_14_0_10_46_23]|uniref:DOD-type homing endonuclease domain-containing protein n=1 Tax=Candidatus Yanofskybacteria bacterium CG10_big_fil_rev_8_21_14_0_10_46_23 TaxID=1975098 RepID=A0A2H0R675_9BACT|nr:MAG: hypothetical protein COV31_01885 [Candidatus Yanofskybacteria bacterium CG10_big_fil_rev_8_21_14_0_10_46_23]
MAKKWTTDERARLRAELVQLYILENKTISEIARHLNLGQSAVYDRLKKLDIPIGRSRKAGFNNQRLIKSLPLSRDLAEFVGVLCGDGHIAQYQIWVHLGNKEGRYAKNICQLFKKICGQNLSWYKRNKRDIDLFISSISLVKFFKNMGLVGNKIKKSLRIPNWIFSDGEYLRRFIRGFFDTDGSIYRLKFGVQISFTSKSTMLLKDTRRVLLLLGFRPSRRSVHRIYLTRQSDIVKFHRSISSSNPAKKRRLDNYVGRFA